MDKTTQKASIVSGILYLFVLIIFFEAMPLFNQKIQAVEQNDISLENTKEVPETETMEMNSDDNLVVPIPEGVDINSIEVGSCIIYKKTVISFNIEDDIFDIAEVVNTTDAISGTEYKSESGKIVISLSLNGYYNTKWMFKDGYIYMRFFDINAQSVKVLVDPGHGGNDAGANRDGIYEKNITLSVCGYLKKLAANDDFGVYFTREDDTYLSVEERADFANETCPDLYVSVHINWYDESEINGTEVLYNSYKGTGVGSSYWLAEILDEEVVKSLGTADKGPVAGDSIYVVRYTNAPAALVELGFMTNNSDLGILTSDEGQKKAAEGIYNGIKRALLESGKIN